MNTRGRPKIVILGMLTKIPVGGVAWLIGQYATGFDRLGYETYYVEAHARTPSTFMEHEHDDPTGKAVAFLAKAMHRFGLDGRWAFHALHSDGACYGMTARELRRLYRDAALIINLHGSTLPRPEHSASGRLVYLGTDPVKIEIELAKEDKRAIGFLEQHVAFFTWGLNYGNPDCKLPWSEAFPFVPSPPPVVIDMWEGTLPPARAPFTTIANWRQLAREIEFEGTTYHWSKHYEWLKFIRLPRLVDPPLELALSSYVDEDEERLRLRGWRVRPAFRFSQDLDAYRSYIQSSRAEFSVAKEQNVHFRSGWFSERSASYLAAGRPVVLQDTGFGNALPTGEGLLAFSDLDEAASAIDEVAGNGARHRKRAGEIAREYLSYDVVLGSLLDHVGLDIVPRHRRSRLGPPVELPPTLSLTPQSRRPVRLPNGTVETVLSRPVPSGYDDVEAPYASIVVVALDNEPFTRLTLESVLANTTEVSFELVVVDNGSAEPTRNYLSVLAARNLQVHLIRNDANRGFAPAVNQGVAVSRGEVIVLLNNDTITPPGWLAGLVRHLDDPQVGIVCPSTNRSGTPADVSTNYDTCGDMVEFSRNRRASDAALFDIPVAPMFCVGIRREVRYLVGPLDEQFEVGMFEDDDYSRRIREHGLRVVCAPDVFVHHFGEASLGHLFASGRYREIFDANRNRFEAKWRTVWTPHDRIPEEWYLSLRRRVRNEVERLAPAGSVVLMISKGDDALLELSDRVGLHFPQLPDGRFSGSYPADDDEAIAALEALRTSGGDYLVVPASSLWWLDHYAGFRSHLEHSYRRALSDPSTAVIYELRALRDEHKETVPA